MTRDLAETVAKLVNTVVLDIVDALNADPVQGDTRAVTDGLLQSFLPHLLRFFVDQYDEVSCTVISSLSELLAFFRKVVKVKAGLPQLYSNMLAPIMEAVVSEDEVR